MIPLPTKDPLEWTSGDALALRNFFLSATGQRALYFWNEASPCLLDGSDVNKTLVASGELKGYQNSIVALLSLTIEQPTTVKDIRASLYPDIDDDKHWDDEQTRRPSPPTK